MGLEKKITMTTKWAQSFNENSEDLNQKLQFLINMKRTPTTSLKTSRLTMAFHFYCYTLLNKHSLNNNNT